MKELNTYEKELLHQVAELDALPVGEQDLLLETIIQGTTIANPKEMAHHILEQVLAWTGKEPADDMTVLAVGIWEC